VALASGSVVLGLAAGCSTGDRNAAAPARTETVIRTVTKAAAAAPPPHRRPALPISPSYATYTGTYFKLDYPDTWDVEAAEVRKGGYYDTTIRSLSDPGLMIRVDVTPGASADAYTSANDVEGFLAGQPGYRRLRFAPVTFAGYDGVDWEFIVPEKGVLLHKQDTFFNDESGHGFAILTQAPAGQFARWRSAFEQVRQSLLVTPPPAEPVPSDSSATDFCASHACIDNFDNGSGYIVQCNDGMWSHSGGLQGACSYHGGESSNVYSGSSSKDYGSGSNGYDGSGSGTDLGPANGYTVTCADGSISHSGGIQGACSHHGGVAGGP
jgi:hypothetical protein